MSKISARDAIKRSEEVTNRLQNKLEETKKKLERGELILDQKATTEFIVYILQSITTLTELSNGFLASIVGINEYEKYSAEVFRRIVNDISKNEKLSKKTRKQLKELQKHKVNLEWLDKFFKHEKTSDN